MKSLSDYKEELHSCSKCGLCQSVCPLYKYTGNDCTVSRGQFIMLRGVIKGELKMSQTINKYLSMCLKCGACSKFCPSGLDVVDIILAAKAEYYKNSMYEHFVSFIQKQILLKLIKFVGLFVSKKKSKKFEKKVIYFGGCSSSIRGNKAVVNILNSAGIEVISPNFDCCGITFLMRGDFAAFNAFIESFLNKLAYFSRESNCIEIVTTCASCEKVLKDYKKYSDNDVLQKIKIKNIFEYLKDNNIIFELKNPQKVTFHKPCNINNYEDIKWLLENTKNLEYVEMTNYDKCCGFNSVFNFKFFKIIKKLLIEKNDNIIKTGTQKVLTSCLGCECVLTLFSGGKYKVADLCEFLNKNL